MFSGFAELLKSRKQTVAFFSEEKIDKLSSSHTLTKKLIDFFRLNKKTKDSIAEEKSEERDLLQKKLVDELEESIPRDFIDSFTEELISQPVMTEYGHVFERTSIEHWLFSNDTCPLTRQVLTPEGLLASPGIQKMLQQFKQQLEELLKKINDMQSINDESKLRGELRIFKNYIEYYYSHRFNEEKDLLTQQIIQSIKDEKHLNINSHTDLEYWSESNRCCNIGLTQVRHEDRYFFLSESVHRMLVIANKKYTRIAEFRDALENAKVLKSGWWGQFWNDTPNARQMLTTDFSNTHIINRFH